MPCWYFERKEIRNSPSLRDGIDSNTESRYRREGARFILDAGTKMMLRYDTCATGVVYFHRFYMFHSFKDFYRYVTAACCLFLAGKVEETPKKCKDIVKAAQMLLSPASFARFGDDPREELMMMERVLLKTIKFDLQVEHPYFHMLKNAKLFKGSDKEKTQKMAQMAWTFINDSLCTTLCLQWEPEIIAVALMYLASRLTKFEPTEWSGRSSSRNKWWEDFIEGMSLELMEDICHQVLDLYSKQSKKTAELDSPPQTPSKQVKDSPPPPPPPDRGGVPGKRSREVTPSEPEGMSSKSAKHDREGRSSSSKPSSQPSQTAPSVSGGAPIPVTRHITSQSSGAAGSNNNNNSNSGSNYPPGMEPPSADFSSFNPYVSSQMFSSSFLSSEGSQNIQSILAGSTGPAPPASGSSAYPPDSHPHHHPHHHSGHHMPHDPTGSAVAPPYLPPTADMSYQYPPPPAGSQYPGPPVHSYPPPIAGQAIPTGGPPPPTAPPPAFESYPSSYPSTSFPPPPGAQPPSFAPPQSSYSLPPPSSSYGAYPYPPGNVPPPSIPPPQFPSALRDQPPPAGGYPPHPPPGSSQDYGGHRHRGYQKHNPLNPRDHKDIPALTEIKITGPSYYQE